MKKYTDSFGPLETMDVKTIAYIITREWAKVNYAAKPYLEAMATINNVNDRYGFDSGRSIVNYFLANAGSWRGDIAKEIKKELKKRVK